MKDSKTAAYLEPPCQKIEGTVGGYSVLVKSTSSSVLGQHTPWQHCENSFLQHNIPLVLRPAQPDAYCDAAKRGIALQSYLGCLR